MSVMNIKKLCFVGGDKRMQVAADRFEKDGYTVSRYAMAGSRHGEEQMLLCDAVILPLPYTFDGETVYAPYSAETVTLFDVQQIAETKPVLCGGEMKGTERFINYFDDALQTMNAVPTAEAAIAIAIEHTDSALMQCKALIIGGGRIAKALALRLKAFGTDITVAARKAGDRAFFESISCKACAISAIKSILKETNMVFNTVPARIFDSSYADCNLASMPLIELASSPYCIAASDARDCGFDYIKAPGLPGKYFYITAGEAIYKRLKELIESEHII